MSLSNAQLDALDRELDENQRELIILPMDGPITRIPPFTTVPSPTKAPQICTRTQPGLLDGAWGRTQAAYNGTVHEYVNTNAGVPSALGVYDLYNFAKFYRDIGGFGTKVKISTHNGRQYLVLTGLPGLRNKLKGTRYGIRNPQLVEMGIGKYGIRGTSISGFKLSCYVAVGIEVLEWVFNDEAVMSDLFAGIGVELVKAGIASVLGYAVAMMIGGSGVAAAAAAPVFVGAVVVLIAGIALNAMDNQHDIKKYLKAAMRRTSNQVENLYENFRIISSSELKEYLAEHITDPAVRLAEDLHTEAKAIILRQVKSYESIPPAPRMHSLPNFSLIRY